MSKTNFWLAVLIIPMLLLACGEKTERNESDAQSNKSKTVTSVEKDNSQSFSKETLAINRRIDCPEAPQQIAKDVLIDAKGKVEGIAVLPKAEIEGKLSIISKDLLSKYPNADKLQLARLLMNVLCEQLKNSSMLTDSERIDRIEKLNSELLKLFTASVEPDYRARAVNTNFGRGPDMVDIRILVSSNKSPTLYIFEPQCIVVIYASTIHPPGKRPPLISMVIIGEPMYAKPSEIFKHQFTTDDPFFASAIQWALNDASYGNMAQSGKEHFKEEARKGQDAIANKEFEVVIAMQAKEVSKCEGSYYVDAST